MLYYTILYVYYMSTICLLYSTNVTIPYLGAPGQGVPADCMYVYIYIYIYIYM